MCIKIIFGNRFLGWAKTLGIYYIFSQISNTFSIFHIVCNFYKKKIEFYGDIIKCPTTIVKCLTIAMCPLFLSWWKLNLVTKILRYMCENAILVSKIKTVWLSLCVYVDHIWHKFWFWQYRFLIIKLFSVEISTDG